MNELITSQSDNSPIAFQKWLQQVGVTPISGWRWRKRGWIKTLNIAGRVYTTPQAITEFTRRAQAGEFAAEHKVPKQTAPLIAAAIGDEP